MIDYIQYQITQYDVLFLALVCLVALSIFHMVMWTVHSILAGKEHEDMLQSLRDEYQELMTGFPVTVTTVNQDPQEPPCVYHHIEHIESRWLDGQEVCRMYMKRAGDSGIVCVDLFAGDVVDYKGEQVEPLKLETT